MEYWVNMEGVLALYNKEAYLDINPIFDRAGSDYFRFCYPDGKMISILKYLDSVYIGNVKVFSPISDGAISKNQMFDKLYWLDKYCPFLCRNQIFFMSRKDTISDYVCTSFMREGLTKDFVLIDSDMKNVFEWNKIGGRSIQYVNCMSMGYHRLNIKDVDDRDLLLSYTPYSSMLKMITSNDNIRKYG